MTEKQIQNRFIQYGLTYTELNEFLSKEFQNDGYSGCEIHHHTLPIQIILRISKPANEVIGTNKMRIKQVRNLIAKRLQTPLTGVEILVEMIKKRGLCPITQAENIRARLIAGMTVRRAVSGSTKAIKEDGGQGCEVIISGKLKGQRARSMKFVDGLLIHSGQPKEDYMRSGFTSVLLKQGVIGIKVKIMLPHDPEGKDGPSREIADKITVFDPKE